MNRPFDWECPIWAGVLETLEYSGKTDTSYYVLAQECVRQCELEAIND